MKLLRIENAINTCKKHLENLGKLGLSDPEIESYLTGYLAVMVCAEYEECIEKLIVKRGSKANDEPVTNFIKSNMHEKFRNPDIGKITKVLKQFSSTYNAVFATAAINNPSHAAWDNIIKARHAVAHSNEALNITFSEIESAVIKSGIVLESLAKALELNDDDLKEI